jgi:nucleoside-diphosphate-sugar epimerase
VARGQGGGSTTSTILITGGAGFIGSHLADRLLERGDSVLVIDNFASARRDTLPQEHERLRLAEGSIADTTFIEHVLGDFGPEVVVHAAASYKDPDDWDEDARTNAVGTANVVQAAQRAQVGRFLYFQTALCYGLHPQEQPITLGHPLDPSASSYAISKTAGEWYVRLSELDWISLRLAEGDRRPREDRRLPRLLRIRRLDQGAVRCHGQGDGNRVGRRRGSSAAGPRRRAFHLARSLEDRA